MKTIRHSRFRRHPREGEEGAITIIVVLMLLVLLMVAAFGLGAGWAALTRAIPGILVKLGFRKSRAEWIGSHIRVDNARSAGHAWGPGAGSLPTRLLQVIT